MNFRRTLQNFHWSFFCKVDLIKKIFFRKKNTVLTYCYRDLDKTSGVSQPQFNTAIVMQGPIIRNNNFTCKVASYYRNAFPNVKLVISTWENELPSRKIEHLRELGIIVVLNQVPSFHGRGNVNLQLISTSSGIKALEKFDIKRIIKTRTDQALLNPYLFSIIEDKFILNSNKIMVSTFNSFSDPLVSLSDMFQYGNYEDIREFWIDCKLQSSTANPIPEIYLLNSYLSNKIGKNHQGIQLTEKMLLSYFSLVNGNLLDLIWNKKSLHDIKTYRWNIELKPIQE